MATKFDEVRASLMEKARELFTEMEYDVLQTGTQEICLPVVGKDNEDGYLVIKFTIPKGSRDGEPYDGYAVAEDFQITQEIKTEAKRKRDEAKAKKMARDAKMREAKAKAKAEREERGE